MREPAAVFLAAAALGLAGAAPGVTTGDAGELAAASAVLGVAHAPGYPLYALSARAFGLLLPFGAWTWRLNAFSAVLGAAALALFAAALRRWGFSPAARLGATAVLGLAPAWRGASSVTEVFALHAFCACLLLWLASSERVLDDGPAACLGLVFGLSLANHQTMALVLPALLFLGAARPRALACAALGAAAGFALYAYLPLRAAASPPLDWGHATTPSAFLHVLLRRDYGSFALTTDGAGAFGLPELARQLWRGLAALGPVAAPLALAGAVLWPRPSRLPLAVPAAWLLLAGPGFLLLGRPGFDAQTAGALERFSVLPLVGAALLAAGAFERLRLAAPVLAAAAFFVAPPAGARGDFLAHDYGRALLNALPPGATFVMDGGDDTFYSLAALKWAHGLRPDLALADRGGVVFPGFYGADFRRLPRALKEERRRVVEAPLAEAGRLWYSTLNPGLLPGRELVAGGLVRRPAPFPEAAALDETLAVRPGASGAYRDRALAAFVPFSRGVAALDRDRADEAVSWLALVGETAPEALWVPPAVSYALGVAGWRALKAGDHALAERAYRAAAALDAGSAEACTNLGALLDQTGRRDEAEAWYREGARRDPRSARPWAALGALEWARGRYDRAAEAFSAAARLEPGQPAHAGWADAARRKAGGVR
ncbi:MAG: DUF2723 domain-containing protein [Elusimicrobiota bacterium]|nr:DUF2723 domain-containing protein [Elusimicrobiota bacterium]